MTDDHSACCHTPSQLPVLSETVVDPVCGMTVDPKSAAGSHTYQGTAYYFCSTHCVDKFQADPERFLTKKTVPTSAPAAPATSGPDTCPMLPEIVQDGPGTCPNVG